MSTVNAIADVQPGQEVVLPECMPSELTGSKFTAAQIENDCPVRLQDLAKRITEGLEKVYEQKKLADDQEIAVKMLIAEVKALCDVGGFAAFREKFFPNLRKSRVYELLAIGTNKKSVQDIKAGTRGRVAKHRAKKAEASPNSVTVTENPEPVGPSVPTENGAVQATSKIDADNAEASTNRGKTECAKREAGRKPQAQKALDEFKYAVNHWLPQMDDDTKREAVEYAVAKSGVTVSCASDK